VMPRLGDLECGARNYSSGKGPPLFGGKRRRYCLDGFFIGNLLQYQLSLYGINASSGVATPREKAACRSASGLRSVGSGAWVSCFASGCSSVSE
jgi:hypothetical protein